MKTRLAVGATIILMVSLSTSLYASVLNVPTDYSTIQSGLNSAVNGDTVLVQPGTYFESIDWPDVNGIKLISAGDTTNTFIDGGDIARVILFNSGVIDTNTVISGFTIQNGYENNGAGIRCGSGASPLLTNLLITKNVNTTSLVVNYKGGGLACYSSSPVVRDVTFLNNDGRYSGGGAFCENSSASFYNVKFIGNTARINGGGIFTFNSPITCEKALFERNRVINDLGGAIASQGTSPVYNNVIITENRSELANAISVIQGELSINNSAIFNNSTSGNKAILVRSGTLNISNTNIYEPDNAYVIKTDGTDPVVNASNNWWGDESGPYNPTTNPNGTGGRVDGVVVYDPFLTSQDPDAPILPVKNINVEYDNDLSAEITWDRTILSDLAGYTLCYNIDVSGEPYSNTIDVGTDTTYLFDELIPDTDYYIAIKCFDIDGNESEYREEISFISRQVITENLHLDAVANMERVTDYTPTISYDFYESLGGDQGQYKIQVSTDSTFTSVDKWNSGWVTSTSTNITYDGNTLDEGDKYFLRLSVKASDAAQSQWYYLQFKMNSKPTSITQVSPQDETIIVEEPVLSVNQSTDADGDTVWYSYKVYTDDALTQLVRSEGNLLEETWIVDPPLEDDEWYWWTCEVTDSIQTVSTESAFSFRTNIYDDPPSAFSLSGPQDGSICVTGDTLLTWGESSDPDYEDVVNYIVWFSTSSDFSSEVDSFFTSGTSLEVHDLPQNQMFWWKVRAQDTNTAGTWSTETWSFSVALPDAPSPFTLISPHDEATNGSNSIELKWSSSTDPDPDDFVTYEFQSSTDPDFLTYDTLLTNDTTLTLEFLEDDMTYYWRVKAFDTSGLNIWSIQGENGWSFSVDIQQLPLPFSLVSPDSAMVLDTLASSFVWNQTFDPDPGEEVNYFLSLSLDQNFVDTLTVLYQANTDTSFPVPYMLDDSDYWWRVLAFDDRGNTTISNEIWSFHTAWPEPPHPFELDGGSLEMNTAGDSIVVTLTWQRTWDPDPESQEYYRLMMYTSEDMNTSFVLADSVSTEGSDSTITWSKTYAPQDLPTLGQSFWNVLAYDDNTEGTWSDNVLMIFMTSVDESSWGSVPQEYEISSVYPNPFNPTLRAVISLPMASNLEVHVFNVMGQKVATLANSEFAQGHHSMVFDGTGMASGVYFIHASVPGKLNQVQKVILMK